MIERGSLTEIGAVWNFMRLSVDTAGGRLGILSVHTEAKFSFTMYLGGEGHGILNAPTIEVDVTVSEQTYL